MDPAKATNIASSKIAALEIIVGVLGIYVKKMSKDPNFEQALMVTLQKGADSWLVSGASLVEAAEFKSDMLDYGKRMVRGIVDSEA